MENNDNKEEFYHVLKPKRIIKSASPEDFVHSLNKEEVISLSKIENQNYVVDQILKASIKSGYEPSPFLFMYAKPHPSDKGTLFLLIIKNDKTLVAYDINNGKRITFKSKIIYFYAKSGRKIQFLLESGLMLKFTLKQKFDKFAPIIERFFNDSTIPYYIPFFASASELPFPVPLFPDFQTLLYPIILSPSLDFILKITRGNTDIVFLSYIAQIVSVLSVHFKMFHYTFSSLLDFTIGEAESSDYFLEDNHFIYWYIRSITKLFMSTFADMKTEFANFEAPATKEETNSLVAKAKRFIHFFQTHFFTDEIGFIASKVFECLKAKFGEEESLTKCTKFFFREVVNMFYPPKEVKEWVRVKHVEDDVNHLFDFSEQNINELPNELKEMIPQIKTRVLEIFTKKYSCEFFVTAERVLKIDQAILNVAKKIGYNAEVFFRNENEIEFSPFAAFVQKSVIEARRIVDNNLFESLNIDSGPKYSKEQPES